MSRRTSPFTDNPGRGISSRKSQQERISTRLRLLRDRSLAVFRCARGVYFVTRQTQAKGDFHMKASRKFSRRDLSLLLPALAAGVASAQSGTPNGKQAAAAPAADNSVEKLPVMKTQAFL